MAMVVKNNLGATKTLNTLNKNSKALEKSLAKVSSGMKINSAQDDASGYSISESMRVRIRALDQANANTQNSSSMIKVAEGAIDTTLELVKTMKEKAINSANDHNSQVDRLTIQKELDQYIDQVDDNALTTFNGKILLDGSSMPLNHNSYNDRQNIIRGLNSSWLQSAMDLISETYGLDFTQNGNNAYQMDIEFVGGDTGIPATTNAVAQCGASVYPDGSLVDGKLTMIFNMDKIQNLDPKDPNGSYVGSGKQYLDRVITHELVHGIMFSKFGEHMYSGAPDELPSYIIEGGTAELIHGADDTRTYPGSASACLADDYGGGFVAMRYFSQTANIDPVKAMKKFMKTLDEGGSVDDAFAAASGGKWTSKSDFETSFTNAGSNWSDFLTGLGIDTTNTDTGALTGYDATGKVVKTAKTVVKDVGSTTNWRMPSSTSTVIGGLQINWPAGMNVLNGGGGNTVMHVGEKANQSIKIGFADMRAKSIGLYDDDKKKIDVTTQGKAREAIGTLDRVVENILEQQTNIGAMLQRLDYTSSNLVTGTENTQAAESVIRDSDMAKEMTAYTKNNVLLQAAQSMLAQANQSSSAVLSLLQ